MRLLLLLCLCICLNTQAQKLTRFIKDFPDFKEVVDKFYNEYQPGVNIDDYYTIEFSRRPYGWSIVKIDYPSKDTNSYFFWSVFKGYHQLNAFDLKNPQDSSTFKDHLAKENIYNEHTIRMFKIHTFYGYKGWQQDIIKNLEPINTELNDEDLYSLARAYSISFIEVQNDTSFLKLKALEKEVEYYTEKATKYFEIIFKRNPLFNDIVGKTQTKYANEYLSTYYYFKLIDNETKAKTYIKPNIYPEEIVSNAKNYLKNCPLNAILITNGDNDTYPLWYIQELENYRKDVTVINLSLLQLYSYIRIFKQLKFTLSPYVYKNLDYINHYGNKKSITLDSLFNFINHAEIKDYGLTLENTYQIIENNFKPTKSFIHKSELAWLDMYYSNIDKPICTTDENAAIDIFGNHFENLGAVCRLNPQINSRCNLKEMLFFLDNLDTTGYQNIKNYPFKPNTNEYIDKRFIELIYESMLKAMRQAKAEKETDYFNQINTKWLYFAKTWAVKPNAYFLEEYQSIINANEMNVIDNR